MVLRAIGYWADGGEPALLPHPTDLVDGTWDAGERDMVVSYLERGHVVAVSMGSSVCRICGERVGSTELTDGTFIWPEGLPHDLVEHGVRLPDEFIEQFRRRLAELEVSPVDTEWWVTAAARRRA